MAQNHIVVFLHYAVPGQETALQGWLGGQHIPDLLAVPGIASATQYSSTEIVKLPRQVGTPDSTLICELDAYDPDVVVAEFTQRMGTAKMPWSPALDRARTIALIGSAACVLEPASQTG